MVSSLLLTCSHAPLLTPPKLPSSLIGRFTTTADAVSKAKAKAGAPLFSSDVCRPGRAGGWRGWALIYRDSSLQGPPDVDSAAEEQEKKKNNEAAATAAARIANSGGSGGGKLSDWAASVLLFGMWVGLIYYVFQLAPNQTS